MLVESVGERLIKITGTDLDTTIITTVEAEVTEPGAMCVSAKKLYDIVKFLPRQQINFRTEAKNQWTHIECQKSNFKIACAERDSFPSAPPSGRRTIEIPASVLHSFIRHTSFAVTNEQSRFSLSGAKLELKGRTARMVTTDGHRLSLIETTLDTVSEVDIDVLIPRKALAEIVKLVSADDQEAVINFGEDVNHLFFQHGSRLIVTRKLTGAFPNYSMVIPKDNDCIASFDASLLLAAVRRVSQMADAHTNAVHLTVRPGEIAVTARSAEEGEAEEIIAAEYAGAEMTLKFQYEYVSDFLNSMKDDENRTVSMSFKNADAQTLFRPVIENNRKIIGIVIPLRH